MSNTSELNFVRQQGFGDVAAPESGRKYSALMFQPRMVGTIVAIGLITQAWPVFLGLSAVLWWNALVPTRNLFDALFNALVARPRGLPPLTPAPAPRRFAQGMAATFNLAIGLSLLAGMQVLAFILEGFLVVALLALVFGRFCLGSYLFLVLKGQHSLANRTLPWAKAEAPR